ncbi:DUF2115 domain-containing protein [Methanobacterium aggregans]|uniref:DUF2115 domain-containing protein n=1 Tax=Methanobacterium aggregans TaxID=1615586 RepID=UPI001AE5E91E|nr:DUF2115 domain-containing protein [Methanobacterium aggregans]MBP2046812.1 uncharacterized protein (UPF0305 family) [Methanobacterium aggregans]
MPESFVDTALKEKMTKDELLSLLKREARNLHMKDIMLATAFFQEDAQFMPKGYRDDYIKTFSKAFFTRIKDIKEDENHYPGSVNLEKLRGFFKLLDEQKAGAKGDRELCFLRIASLVATYTTFIREESIHPIGTKFPGGFTLRFHDGEYLCPVKDRQEKNPSALCRFCVSVQDEDAV